jgi:hypothetical protein
MASTSRSTVESLDTKGSSTETEGSKTSPKGPPPASPKPRSSADSSLYATAGKAGMTEGLQGLGSEGNSPSIMGMQGLALVQRGIQMLNLAFPENPGLVAVLADITGRLQTLIPQLAMASSAPAGGMMGAAMQPGMGQPGMMAGPMGAGPMGAPPPGAGAPPQPGAPMGPPVPPVQ